MRVVLESRYVWCHFNGLDKADYRASKRKREGKGGGREGGRAYLHQHLVQTDIMGKSITFSRVLLVL